MYVVEEYLMVRGKIHMIHAYAHVSIRNRGVGEALANTCLQYVIHIAWVTI